MFQRRQKRFRRRPNGGSHTVHSNGHARSRLRSDSFSNDQKRNNFRSPQSAEKLLEKYTTLAKEAISSGDKILSETYSQHADHFMRILKEKALNQSKIQTNQVPKVEEQKPSENEGDKQDQSIEEKK